MPINPAYIKKQYSNEFMSLAQQPFPEFLKDFEKTLAHLFHEQADINTLSLERGLPAEILSGIMAKNPLSVAIPAEFGGRGSIVKECLGILSAASYESLSLSLTFGINIALFLEPVSKYANESVKKDIFDRFLKKATISLTPLPEKRAFCLQFRLLLLDHLWILIKR